MTAEVELALALDGARLVRYDPETQLVQAWFGGTIVNVYRLDGSCVDCWSRSNEVGEPCDLGEILDSMIEHETT